jgi:hypothetical protein
MAMGTASRRRTRPGLTSFYGTPGAAGSGTLSPDTPKGGAPGGSGGGGGCGGKGGQGGGIGGASIGLVSFSGT